jgi:Flp pilus assembly pilin Flp
LRPESPQLRRFFKAEDGPTTVEYAVILALILVGAILIVMGVGNSTSRWWHDNADRIITAIAA